jgi:ABC-type antimicrobial peptide transport system permease subunit
VLFFFYVYRSAVKRMRANAITIVSVALFVAGCTLGLGFYYSLRSLLHTASPTDVVVIGKGATSEASSMLDIESARKIVILDGVKKTGDASLATRELLSRVYLDTNAFKTYRSPVPIRGIDEQSLAVHHAKVIQGSLPAHGTLDVMLGKRAMRANPTLVMGSEIALPAGAAHVVGIFEAEGSPYEDEVWTPRAALELHIKAKASSSVTLVAESADAVPALVDRINNSKDLKAQALPLTKFREDRFGLRSLATTVFVLLLLLSVVAISAIATTMHAAMVTRLPELAALAAIGIPRSTLRRIIIMESVLIAVMGAILGIVLGQLIRTRIGAIWLAESPIMVSSSMLMPLIGLGLGLLVGLAGGLPSGIIVGRLDIIRAMR